MSAFLAGLQYPLLLALVAALPVAAVLLVVMSASKRRARLQRLGSPEMIARLAPASASRSAWPRALRLALAAALAAVAFAGPRWGAERAVVRGEGIDMVLALDASLSMMAADDRPNRLERMRQTVRQLRAMSRGDRVALIAFAGRSYILTPLTVDDGALDLFLDNLDPSVVGQAGSSVARAIRQSTDLLLTTRATSDRAIVLMSDGESFEPVEDIEEASRRANENGIAVVTVGFGTPQGSTIPVRGEDGRMTTKRDEQGTVVVTRYDSRTLEAAARAANGTFIDAGATDKAARVRRALSTLRTQTRAVETGEDLKPRFQLFLIPAFLLLLLDTILAERRGRRRRAAAASAPAAASVLLAFVLGGCSTGAQGERAVQLYTAGQYAQSAAAFAAELREQDPREPRTLYGYGTALLAADSIASALEPLERSSDERTGDAELRYRALFNFGLAHLERGLAAQGDSAAPALDAALETYKKVLLMRPNDMDAKWNYELALRKKQSGGGGGGGGGGGSSEAPQPDPQAQAQQPQPRPAGGLGQQRAEQLLNSAAREEREVQGKRQRANRADPPPGGKDWE